MNSECNVPIAEKETVSQMSQNLTEVLNEISKEFMALRTLVKPDMPDNTKCSENQVPDCLFANTKINLQNARKLLREIQMINEFM